MINLDYILILSFIPPILFGGGIYMILSKDEIILKLLGVELILNAGNLNVLIMNKNFPQILSGQVFVLFVMTIAAAEVAIALAILVKLMKKT